MAAIWLLLYVCLILSLVMTTPRPQPTPSDPDTADAKVERPSLWLMAIAICFASVLGMFAAQSGLGQTVALVLAISMPIAALFYFMVVVLYTLYLSATDQGYDEAAMRLAGKTALSVAASILSCALYYFTFGLNTPCDDVSGVCEALTPMSSVYFSMVTFSTLGFGDFTPTSATRLVAGALAIIGNLHLGIFVGIAVIGLKGR